MQQDCLLNTLNISYIHADGKCLHKKVSDIEGYEGGNPRKSEGVDRCEDWPFPATAFLLDCDESCNAWEV